MARAIWTGSISFGLLNVPVRLYSAVSSRSISFRELREKDGSRVRHKRVAEEDGEEVSYDEIVKGYEIAPDQYVVMTRDEIGALDPKKTKTIEIEDFVDLDQIDPIYFNQPYYIGPAQGAERAYALLAQAMAEQHKVAVSRFVMRNKESLAAIRASSDGEVLTLATMRFADEVVPTSDLEDVLGGTADVEPKKREIDMAKASDRLPLHRLRSELLQGRVPRGAHVPDRAQGRGQEHRLDRLRGADTDEGTRPDGRTRGVPRRDQGRGAERRREEEATRVEVEVLLRVLLQVEVLLGLEGEEQVEGQGREVEVDGRRLSLTNLDKVLYPQSGFTKGQVIDYYARIAPVLLPHLQGRPVTLIRYPNGVEGKYFYEKNSPSHRPDWVQTAPIFSGERAGIIDYTLVEDLPTLTWLAQLAALELHPSLSLAAAIERPTVLAFDLDPGPPATIVECCRVAILLRKLFAGFGLECFPKSSGSKGMQVYVPLNRELTYETTKPYARAVAQALEAAEPDLILSRMTKSLRAGKVFVDWSQNTQSKTTVAPYSLRAREAPTASTPLTWEEVEDALEAGDPDCLRFEGGEVLERVERHGDLFAPVLELEQDLPAAP